MKYLVCIDGSDSSDRAFSRFSDIFHPETDSVSLFTSFPLPSEMLSSVSEFVNNEDSMDYDSSDEDSFRMELARRKNLARKIIDDHKRKLSHKRCNRIHEIICETDDPAAQIIEEAESKGADVIVIGSDGSSSNQIYRFLWGSVSTQIVQKAKCSVMVMK
eukprot:TRINITY_DN5609_c0_g1_i1.p1 TRINITY_DN5609_c0_g1~~TRINITY_DN5609_c0_g1_i1.p1  ORF type:complete len:160 (-),score=47.30 TRINITY_DN5609_c0_g1_i1:197-676(-)